MRHQEGFFASLLWEPIGAGANNGHRAISLWNHYRISLVSILQTLEKKSDITRHVTVITSVMPFNIKVEPLVAGGTDPKTVDPVGIVVLRTDELVLSVQVLADNSSVSCDDRKGN